MPAKFPMGPFSAAAASEAKKKPVVNVDVIALVRGIRQDGTYPPYNRKDFPEARNPSAATRFARNSVSQNFRHFHAILQPKQVVEAIKTATYRGKDITGLDRVIELRNPPVSSYNMRQYEKMVELLTMRGFGEPVFAIYGNPPTVTTFLPKILVDDEHSPDSIRESVYRIEDVNFFQSPGSVLASAAKKLLAEADIDLVSRPDWPGIERFPTVPVR